MKKSKIKTFLLLFLLMLALSGCGSNAKTVEKISSNEITATGEFEEGTTLAANKITIGSEGYKELSERVDLSQFDGLNLVIYDFSLEKDGKTVETKKDVTITLPKPFMSPNGFETHHVKKDNSIEKLETVVDGGNISFTTNSFSTFIITGISSVIVNPTNNFSAYADTETQGRIVVNKEEKASYADKLEIGDEIILNAIPYQGYEFVGWYKGSKLSGSTEKYEEYKEEAFITFNGEKMEIYARFMPIEYKISYELAGGSLNESVIYSYNIEDDDIILPTPVKEYYRFAGWLNNDRIISTIQKGTTGDVNLIATWNQISGLPRSIEITKDPIGEIEQGEENVLTPSDYAVTVDDLVTNGADLSEEDGVITIEYKAKDSDDDYSTAYPTELGDYLVRVRISKSSTDPYYSEAVSAPKEFKIVARELKTKFNVLGNYWYDRYTLKSDDKITRYEWRGSNVLGLEDISAGDFEINGYQITDNVPLANLMFSEWKEKYTEVRLGSMDGIAIGRIRVFGAHYVTVEDLDDNGTHIGSHTEYSAVSVQGRVIDPKFTKVVFELLPNIEGYTDSEGKWIYDGKSLDVCTFTHFIRDNYNQPGVGAGVTFSDYAYNGYKDEGTYYQYALYEINNDEIDYGFLFFTPSYNFKYDIEITGDVLIYRFDSRDNSTTLIPTKSFMTVSNERKDEQDQHYYRYIFVVRSNQKVIIYNGKSFSLDKANVL